MGLTDFRIEFENPECTYFPGQTVTGRIVVALDSAKTIRGICVKVKGAAATGWSESITNRDNRGETYEQDETISSTEKYFETEYYLIGSSSGSGIKIEAGEHKFPFQCILPPSLPSSFEGSFGHVRYTVKAVLDRPWKFDQEVKKPFTVVSPFDLNEEPRAGEPVEQEMSKTFRCLCCATLPLTVNYSIPARGYVPGQSIPVKVNIENLSGVSVSLVKLIFRKVITYRGSTREGTYRTKTDKMVVAEVSRGPFEGTANAEYEQSLDVPAVPPSNLKNCSIIEVEYNLKVMACVPQWYYRNLSNHILVFVGTVPLARQQTASAPPMEAIQPTGPTVLGWNIPPPSYEASKDGARNLREPGESEYTYGLNDRFVPRYPVYNFASVQ